MHIPTSVLRLLIIGAFLLIQMAASRRRSGTRPPPKAPSRSDGEVASAAAQASKTPDVISNEPLTPK